MVLAVVLLALMVLALVLLLVLAAGTIKQQRTILDSTRRSLRLYELRNNELRQQLNHTCEHRACRLAKRIGLT